MALPSLSVGITQRELNRLSRELGKIQALADPNFRGASAGSVARYALNRTGTVARKILRNSAPLDSGGLRRSVHGRVIQTGDGLIYKAGFQRKRLRRWQQAMALEFGARKTRPRRLVATALAKSAGDSGEQLAKIFIQEMDKRIARLARNANAKARKTL